MGIKYDLYTGCRCRRCLDLNQVENSIGLPVTSHSFIVCEICGNKRCPHATNHIFECTESNKPGQKGSIYQ